MQLKILLVRLGWAKSHSEAKRMALQGGVKIDSVQKLDGNEDIVLRPDMVIQWGLRKFARIAPPACSERK